MKVSLIIGLTEWEGAGVYALVHRGSTAPPNPQPYAEWVYAGTREDVTKYHTIADGRRTTYAREVADLRVTSEF